MRSDRSSRAIGSGLVIVTAAAPVYRQARHQLVAAGVLGEDELPNPDRLITELERRGWAVAVSAGRLHEQSAMLVVATRGVRRHAFWSEPVAVGLVLALAAALRDDDPLRPRHDEGGVIW